MAELRKLDETAVKECAEIYIGAYGEAPWDEKYRREDVEKYMRAFLNSDAKCAYVLAEGEHILGAALGVVVPCIGSCYFRLEDICIDPEYQGMGYGRELLGLMSDALREKGCDSILLGTQKGYPSHRFYMGNGFREIDSVLLFREIDKVE